MSNICIDDAVMENQGNWFQAIAHYPTNTLVEIANRCRKSRELLIKFDDATPKHASNISTTRIHFISLDLTPITFRIRTEDIQLMVPVVSKVTGRVYDNFNSSVCHGEELTGFTLTQHHLFNVFVQCRRFHDTDRLCVVNSQLSRGVVWIFQLLVCILPQQTILSHVAALISSGHGTTLEYVSLMNSLMNRFPQKSV
ncbi:hypothetical protein EWB00_005376 [Schistosoma japonicum]|uniref:Uncharacterized protein n=1 Tax=Schistosoma japonicum TaxID=6182 RepID=A0A4Z2D2M9_SCHJA|nr:hypothetical protein EWB00_005376 [Schistosoma japonicum]